ncbi:MAG: SusC/RagA family TonB-linked outer membrane protein [Culturomica sp.]|jgi:TonB-linked SusC/RagA family outer membrane protein|nr:SusC/RagA family TonB-linked outer membrane protein [Culturomica sp.]
MEQKLLNGSRTKQPGGSPARLFSVLLLSLWCVVLSATGSYAQNQQRITLNLKGASAEQILNTLKSSTNHEFFYRVNDLTDVPKRDYSFTNATLEEVMNRLTAGTSLQWSVQEGTVTISRRPAAQAQPAGKISGRVTDEKGSPLPGATVMYTGTNIGVSTDINGEYLLPPPTEGSSAKIKISFIGFQTVEKTAVPGKLEVIALKPEEASLDAVVVTGLFNRPGSSFTGSAKVVSNEELKRVGSGNVFQSLRNLDPSLNLIDNMDFGSDPNRLPSMELRGTTSFTLESDASLRRMYENDPNMPLFILDGFPVSPTRIFDLDMERVQSITLLKDASAKAIYGADAANGVFVIETKRPQGGDMVLTYRGTIDLTMPDLTSYDLTNALEKLAVEKESGIYEQNTNINFLLDNQSIYNERMNRALAGTDTDWLSKPVRTGVGTKHSVGLELNDENLGFMGNVSYSDVAGTMKESWRKTLAATMDVTYRRSGKFLFRNQMSIVSNKYQDSPYGSFSEYAQANPYNDPYDKDGNLLKTFRGINLDPEPNPLWNAQLNTSLTGNYLMFSNNFNAEYYPTEGLTLRLRGSVSTQRDASDRFYPGDHTLFADYEEADRTRKGKFDASTGRQDQLRADFSVMYNKTWAEKHTLLSNFNYNLTQRESRQVTHSTEGFPDDRMDDIMFARQYALGAKPVGFESITRDMSFTGLLSYIYDERYMADFTLRGSASSQYSPKKRWGAFWSLGLAWNLHNESWAENSAWLEKFKLRGSVGSTGTQNVDAYSHLATYNYYKDEFYDMGDLSSGNGAYLLRLANEGLLWQQTLEYNIGFDATLWKNRLNIVFDYYLRNTKDLVASFTLPPSTGYTSIKENVGEVRNSGIDLTLSYRLIDRPDFFLNLTGALSMNKNKLTKISDAMREYNERMNSLFTEGDHDGDGEIEEARYLPVLKYVEGGSMTSIWAVPSLGIDPASGEEIFMRRDGVPTYSRYYSASDQVVVGNSREKYRGNFGVYSEYKGFGLSVTCRFLGGGEYYNQTLINKVENIDITKNVDRRVFTGRWSTTNRHAPYKAFRVWDSSRGAWINAPKTQASSRFVQKRNELDIAAISAYYDLHRLSAIKAMGLNRLRLGVNMNEVHKFSSIQIERGTEYPFARTLSFSLTAEF